MQYRLNEPLNILLVDDDPVDRRAVIRGFSSLPVRHYFQEAEGCVEARRFINSGKECDIALIDYHLRDGLGDELLPDFIAIGIPVVLVTGGGSENIAISALRGGVSDYVVKDTAGYYVQSLPMIIANVVARTRAEREREDLLQRLQAAHEKIQVLQGLLPICSSCKSIRSDAGYWQRIETFFSLYADIEFTHGLCPDCLDKAMDQLETDA